MWHSKQKSWIGEGFLSSKRKGAIYWSLIAVVGMFASGLKRRLILKNGSDCGRFYYLKMGATSYSSSVVEFGSKYLFAFSSTCM